MNEKKPRGKDDPKGWLNGDGDLRDPQGGTYGELAPASIPDEAVIQPRTAHENAQPGADVRSEPLIVSSEMPEGLRHARRGPLSPSSGRREPEPK